MIKDLQILLGLPCPHFSLTQTTLKRLMKGIMSHTSISLERTAYEASFDLVDRISGFFRGCAQPTPMRTMYSIRPSLLTDDAFSFKSGVSNQLFIRPTTNQTTYDVKYFNVKWSSRYGDGHQRMS